MRRVMNNDESSHVTVITKHYGFPKPVLKFKQTNSIDNEPKRPTIAEGEDLNLESKSEGGRITVDFEASVKQLDAIIQSVKNLESSEEIRDSHTQMHVNILYRPIVKFSEADQHLQLFNNHTQASNCYDPETDKNTHKTLPKVTNPIIRPNNPDTAGDKPVANVDSRESEKLDNGQLFTTLSEATVQPVANKLQSNKNRAAESSYYNTRASCKELLLLKRQRINQNCDCRCSRKKQPNNTNNPSLDQKITNIKYFWRGTNSTSPFAFRKRYMNYYNDTDEISVADIVDYSQKLIPSEVKSFRNL